MKNTRLRDTIISAFVLIFICAFHYESIRSFFLEPLVGRELPKVKFLFPPAGWIMFYNVDERFAHTQIYGIKGQNAILLDPHWILSTRFVGFDDIHRNVLISFLKRGGQPYVCQYLKRKFPEFDDYVVTVVEYPSVSKAPHLYLEQPLYRCAK